MRRGRRWAPLALSLALLLALGGFGLWLVRASTDAAEAALGEGAVGKQRTVAALTDQYLLIAAKEILDFAAAQPFELTGDAPGMPRSSRPSSATAASSSTTAPSWPTSSAAG